VSGDDDSVPSISAYQCRKRDGTYVTRVWRNNILIYEEPIAPEDVKKPGRSYLWCLNDEPVVDKTFKKNSRKM